MEGELKWRQLMERADVRLIKRPVMRDRQEWKVEAILNFIAHLFYGVHIHNTYRQGSSIVPDNLLFYAPTPLPSPTKKFVA